MTTSTFSFALLLAGSLFFTACSNPSQPATTGTDTTAKPVKTKNKAIEVANSANRPPVINITDTVGVKRIILAYKDSAANFERIAPKLGLIYGVKLAEVVKKNKLKIFGAPMAWYRTNKAPYFFEAGIPVDKRPAKLPAGFSIKETTGDSVVIAHFYGPYNLLDQAYTALGDWLKDRKKKASQPPYEIYIGDPMEKDGKLKDPYKVQTDVVQHWH